MKKRNTVLLLFGLVLSTTLIIFAARGDLWFDEILSLSIAETVKSPFEIVTRFQHDNNHILNTFFLFVLGEQENLLLYRLLAVSSGVGTILLLGLTARRMGYFEAICVVFLAGTSYPLILYFSEARGYAPAMFFSVLSFEILQECWHRFKPWKLFMFWASAVFALLSHLTFVFVLLSLLCFSVTHEVKNNASLRNLVIKTGKYYAVPLAFLLLLHLVYIRYLRIGGGPVYSKWKVINQAAAVVLGFPEGGFFQLMSVACVIGLIIFGAWLLYRKRLEIWFFFPLVLFICPGLLVIVSQPKLLYFRYFILCFPFFYLLLSFILGIYYRSSTRGRNIALILMIVLIAAHLRKVVPLLVIGRGSYSTALSDMAANTTDGSILKVAGDDDFRHKVVLNFYSRFLPSSVHLHYVDQQNWYEENPDWIITHSQDLSYKPPGKLVLPGVGYYSLFGEYRFSGVSGWHWFIYRRDDNRRR